MIESPSTCRVASIYPISNLITEGIKALRKQQHKISLRPKILTATSPVVTAGVMRVVTSRTHYAIWIASARVIG